MAKKKQPVSKRLKEFFADKANRKYIMLAVVVVAVFIVAKFSKKPAPSGDTTGNKEDNTGTPVTPLPDYSANADAALGSYSIAKGGREFTFSRTPEFAIQFNDDGTITDITPGLSFDGTTNKIGNKGPEQVREPLTMNVAQNSLRVNP